MTRLSKSDALPLNLFSRRSYQVSVLLAASGIAGLLFRSIGGEWGFGLACGVEFGAGMVVRWLEEWRR